MLSLRSKSQELDPTSQVISTKHLAQIVSLQPPISLQNLIKSQMKKSPKVSPQQTFLESYPDKPLATSTLYINQFTTSNLDGSQNHTVVGVHIVLEKGNQNLLWETFHVDRVQRLDPLNPRVVTRSLQICCDTLEVHGELSVPEADVIIFARRLVWATPDAAINTSPLQWTILKAQNASGSTRGVNGAAGRNAGSFQVFVSEVEPVYDSSPRLVALGGHGQDPGAGLDGKDGRSMDKYFSSYRYEFNDTGFIRNVKGSFNPVAVYVEYEWRWAASRLCGGQDGENSFPESGGDALAPGIPGVGGNGGNLTTNLATILPSFKNNGGQAGTKERDYRGGWAGTPTICAKYKVTAWNNLFKTNCSSDVVQTALNETKKGVDAKAQDAPHGAGSTPKPIIISQSNAWLHPLSLQKTLEYARDLFLAGGRDEVQRLLCAYEVALAGPLPDNKAWNKGQLAQWTAAQSEVASMLQRLYEHLDYFGNVAGYMPALSLQATFEMYEEETKRALRTLLLVKWIEAKARDKEESAKALDGTITSLIKDTQQAANQVTSSETKISEITRRIDSLELELNCMSNQLENLRNELLSQAQNDLDRQAQIKFAINMAAAVCQVIPVGQPALGTVGSLAGVAAGFIGGDGASAPDTVSKMGDVLTKARDAAKEAPEVKKAANEASTAVAANKTSTTVDKPALTTVCDGLGPALSQVAQGMKALQVPESEVEAKLQQLESESEEWSKIVKDIRNLNERKAALFSDLVDAFQLLGDGYSRVSSNAAALFTIQQERGKNLAKLSPEAMGCVQQMGQQARFTLLWYLYLTAKAYETTVFKPISVNWKLIEVGDKIDDLLKQAGNVDATGLNQQVQALEPIYQDNLNVVRRNLLKDLNFNNMKTLNFQLSLNNEQTPEVMALLNNSGYAVIDPVKHELVRPERQLARVNNIELTKIEFDPHGPALTDTNNVIISIKPAHRGTFRKAEKLYSVYSDEPLEWNWTYISGKIYESKRSEASEDMLRIIIGDGAEQIKQCISLPPIWSDFSINLSYSSELPIDQRPRITHLYFMFSYDSTPAPDNQCVLDVQSLGSTAGAVIHCSPPDLDNRSDGLCPITRIFAKGTKIRLSVSSDDVESSFDSWDIVPRSCQINVEKTEVNLNVDKHVLAQCHLIRRQKAPMDQGTIEAQSSEVHPLSES